MPLKHEFFDCISVAPPKYEVTKLWSCE